MRSIRRSPPWIVGSAVVVAILGLAYGYYRFNEALRCDYYTLDVILMVQEYVETHEGNWPSTWEDLADTDRCKSRGLPISAYPRYVAVDFTLTSDQIIEKPELVFRAVFPSSGEYICYPDARRHLERILETIRHEREPHVQESAS